MFKFDEHCSVYYNGTIVLLIDQGLGYVLEGKLKTNVGPEEWLGYIKNAEYVVTNSFHGTVFSILFNKKFFSEVSAKVIPSTSRLKSLLRMFDLENRTIEQFTEEMITEELNSEIINNILVSQRNKAQNFFKEVFL